MDMTTKAYTRSYGMRTEGYWKLNNAKLYTGADLKTESARGTRYKTPLTGAMAGKTSEDNVWQDAVITHTSVFAEYVTHFNRFDFSASGRLEWNRSWSDKEDADFKKLYNNKTDDSQINPNLSMGLVYNIKKNTSLGLWVGRAQRSGSISERYINYFTVSLDPYEVVGNPTIKAEKNNQADLIFNFKTEKTFINIDVFGSYLQDYISSVIRSDLKPKMPSSPGVRQVTNIGKVWKYGVEINWKQELIAGFSHQLSLAYTYGKDLELKEPLPEIAPLYIRYNLYTHFFNRRLTTLLALRHVLKQDRVSYSFAETTTPSFTLLAIDLSYSFTEKIRLSGGVKNLLDTDYHEHLTRALNTNKNEYISAPGRSFFTSFLFSF